MEFNKIFGVGLVLVAVVLVGVLLSVYKAPDSLEVAQAGTSENVQGWSWAENIGWISSNSLDNSSAISYGLDLDPVAQTVAGYMWTENIGYINFTPAGPYPGLPNNSAKIDMTTGDLSGWVRACSVFTAGTCSGALRSASDRGGWDGWIKLRGTATDGSSYGLKLNFATKEFENWAWGGGSEDNNSDKAVIGWVSFNCKNRLSCGTVPYTIATQNFPPKATPIQYLAGDYCKPAESLRGFFQWIFTDPDATDNQDSYKIEVDTDAGFVAPIALTKNGSSTVANGLMGTGALDTPLPSYGTTYYWRVTVWDNLGLGSVAAVGINFSTPAHAYPAPNFTLTPPKPGKDEVVQLCATNNNATCTVDVAQCYFNPSDPDHSCSGKSFNWTFEETLNNGATWQASPVTFANSTNNSSENPAIKFTSAGSKRITLTINDGLGECSTVPKGLKVIAIPRWREVSP